LLETQDLGGSRKIKTYNIFPSPIAAALRQIPSQDLRIPLSVPSGSGLRTTGLDGQERRVEAKAAVEFFECLLFGHIHEESYICTELRVPQLGFSARVKISLVAMAFRQGKSKAFPRKALSNT